MTGQTSFPRQYARTQRFSLGVPNAFSIAPDGSLVAFLRSRAGTDRSTCLWVREVASTNERIAADPAVILAGSAEDMPAQERARRERSRQAASGIVAYATDDAVRIAAFALSGRLFLADLAGGGVSELPAAGPVLDPRPDPAGRHIAYVAGGALRVISADGSADRALAEPDGPDVTYGLAEFVAAEEMARTRGFWWSPDGQSLLAARVDTSPVARWHVADPANPDRPPAEIRYPAAGTANADVSLILAGLDGSALPVAWDTAAFPYLTSVHWSARGAALLQIQTRDQRTMRVLEMSPGGTTRTLSEDTDPAWVDIVAGTPAWTAGGDLVRVVAADGAYRLMIGDEPVTPAGDAPLHVREILDAGQDVLFTATGADPTQIQVYAARRGGSLTEITTEPGLHTAARSAAVSVISSRSPERPGTAVRVRRDGADAGEIPSYAEVPVITPEVTMLTVGEHDLRCALLLPRGYRPGAPGSARLPVLLDPYGGPAAQQVMAARNMYLVSQWFADQGFAVLVADGRGTPGRGPDWDRLIHYDEATPNIEDQIDALHAVAAVHPELDTSRVAIRGWSHGGYLAALAVLRRPDVFHAAVAGAPVTDKALYDTHYTERYMGMPDERPEVYAHNSLIADAPKLRRPLMLIHGFADDNVLVAHTLRLSTALLAAGRPHTVLPLSGITHMPKEEETAENLMLLQVDFLKRALGMEG